MTAYISQLIGAPTSGFYNKNDSYTDANGAVYVCTVTGYAGPAGVVGSSLAQFSSKPQNDIFSSISGLTAFAGGGQASGTAIVRDSVRFTTVGTAADSGKLPAARAGMNITVANAAAANSMNVFPQTGESINALGANVAFALAANKTAEFSCQVDGQWHAVLSA